MSTQKTERVTDEELAFKQFSLPKFLQLSIGDAWKKGLYKQWDVRYDEGHDGIHAGKHSSRGAEQEIVYVDWRIG